MVLDSFSLLHLEVNNASIKYSLLFFLFLTRKIKKIFIPHIFAPAWLPLHTQLCWCFKPNSFFPEFGSYNMARFLLKIFMWMMKYALDMQNQIIAATSVVLIFSLTKLREKYIP